MGYSHQIWTTAKALADVQLSYCIRPRSRKSPAPTEESHISSSTRNAPAVWIWWTLPIHDWRYEDGLKPPDHAQMTQQYLTWSVNSNFCRRKTRLLRVEILGWGPRAERNKYPNVLEIFALHTGPSWLLIRILKLIFRYKYKLLFIFSTFELYLIG